MAGTGEMFDAMQDAFSTIAEASFPDIITIKKSGPVRSAMGGHKTGAPATQEPAKIPCRYKPANGYQKTLAEKPISGTAYMFTIPGKFREQLVSVDSACQLDLAARKGGERARTMQIAWIGRLHGTKIQLMASIEE